MPSPSRSNSSVRSVAKKKDSPKPRKNSSCSRSNKSVKSAQGTKDAVPKKRPVNSSVGSRSRSKSSPKKRVVNSSQGSVQAPKRTRPSNSSRSKSPDPQQKVRKNSSRSNSSKKNSRSGSPQKNNNSWGNNNNNNSWGNNDNNNSWGNRDGGDGRVRGRGRGRGGFGGGDRGGFGGDRGGFGDRGGGFGDRGDRGDRGGFGGGRGGFRNNFNRDGNDSWGNRDNNNNGGGFNRGNFNRNDNFGRNDNFDNRGSNDNSFNRSRSNDRSGSPAKVEEPKKTPQQIRLEEFYNAHKTEGWFKEKYNPISLISQDNERFLYIKKASEEFLQALANKYYDDISLNISEYQSLGNLEFEENEDGEVDEKLMSSVVTLYINDNVNIEGAPLYGSAKDSSTVFIPQIPKEIYKYDIYEVVSPLEGFKNLIVNETTRREDWMRRGWIEFEDESKANAAVEKLKDIQINSKKLQFIKACKRISKAKIVTNYPESRVSEDLANVIEIAAKLDYEAKIYQKNPLYEKHFPNQRKKLYTFLTYLRKVHFFDYFQSIFYDSFRTLSIKSGMTVLLVDAPNDTEIQLDELKKLDERNAIIKQKGSTQFRSKNLDSIKIFTDIVMKKVYDAASFNPDTMPQPKYWKCQECRKKFMTIDHLVKHMVSRHEEMLQEEIEAGQLKIFNKREEEYEKTRREREAKEEKDEKRRKSRKVLKDLDCPEEEEEEEEIKRRLKPVSNSRKLINFLDI